MKRLGLILVLWCFSMNNVNGQTNINTIKKFEHVDIGNLKNGFSMVDSINGEEVAITLTLLNSKISNKQLTAINNFIENLAAIAAQNIKYINEDFNGTKVGVVKEYIQHHLSEIPHEELNKLIGSHDEIKESEKRLLSILKLKRVNIESDKEEVNAIFDYTIGTELTQYLIVVKTDREGNVIDLSVES